MTPPNPIRITNIDDPRVAIFRNQKDAWLTVRRNLAAQAHAHTQTHSHPQGISGTGLDDRIAGLFMAEGELVVRQLVQSEFPVHSVLMGEARLESTADLRADLSADVPVYVADGPTIAAIVGFDLHRGLLAAGIRPRPSPHTLESLAAPLPTASGTGSHRTLIVLEELANHDNIGAIFRNAAALIGADHAGVVLSPRCADPLYRKALRVSIGQALRVPFCWADDEDKPWPHPLTHLATLGYRVLALTPADDAVDIADVPRDSTPTALVLGAEGPGLTDAAMRACTHRVRIPIRAEADSLNVATTAAVALHALVPLREPAP